MRGEEGLNTLTRVLQQAESLKNVTQQRQRRKGREKWQKL